MVAMKSSLLVTAALLLVGCSPQQSIPPTIPPTPETTPSSSPQQSLAPTTRPTPELLDTLPVTLTSTSQRFSLPHGRYAVSWSVEAGDVTGCSFAVVALAEGYPGDGGEPARLLDILLAGQDEASGMTEVLLLDTTYSLEHLDYDESAGVACKRPWSITIEGLLATPSP
jgi:hypothetical protein